MDEFSSVYVDPVMDCTMMWTPLVLKNEKLDKNRVFIDIYMK